VALAGLLLAAPASAQKFLADDPVRRDRDDLPVPAPAGVELSNGYDVIENSIHRRPGRAAIPPAQNINTLGEVPDSSWWTNRIGARPMTIEEMVRGPNDTDGPDVTRPWTIVRGKSGGITPGFTIRDARGDVYFVKFDPSTYFGLATGADVVGSKFFHAMGYNAPTNWIVYVERSALAIGEGAKVRVRGGKPRPMVNEDVDEALAKVARLPDGRIRCVASRAVPGKVLGPHKYYGTRGDDANDVIPHEHRRELRGYRVFSAWLNHDDSRANNSLDTWVRRGDAGYVVHYMQDFSSILGSGSDWRRQIAPQNPRSGNEYILELMPIVKTAFSLGIWQRPWHGIKYDIYPQVGGIEADRFDPDLWKPEYPNPAFERMQPEDAFWAARIISRFTDEAIRAIVKTGDFRAPEAEEHLADVIIRRRDKVLARYFRALNPLADFAVAAAADPAPVVTFVNYGERARLASVEGYDVQWFAFDNASGRTDPIGAPARTPSRSLPLPAARPEYLMARVRTIASGVPAWTRRVDIYVRASPRLEVVGVDREVSTGVKPAGS
jgi:hypothetical protein